MCNNCNNNNGFNNLFGGNNQDSGCNCGCNDRCSNNCGRYASTRQDALKALEFDIMTAKCGVKDIKSGIAQVAQGCVCEGTSCIEAGICNLEIALRNLLDKFESGCFEIGCKAQRLIDEAICSIKEAIAYLHRGLEAIQNGCIQEGIDLLRRGLCIAEEAFCDLIDALRNLC